MHRRQSYFRPTCFFSTVSERTKNNLCKFIPENDYRRRFTDVFSPDFSWGSGDVCAQASFLPCILLLYIEWIWINYCKLSRNFVGVIRTTTINCRVSFIDLYLVFPRNFRIVFLPHTNTVILLEPYCGTITEPGLPVGWIFDDHMWKPAIIQFIIKEAIFQPFWFVFFFFHPDAKKLNRLNYIQISNQNQPNKHTTSKSSCMASQLNAIQDWSILQWSSGVSVCFSTYLMMTLKEK